MLKDAYNPFRLPHDCFSDISGVKTKLILGGVSCIPPKVSILIPTYCRPELLREALASALQQKGATDYEVIVLDNDPKPNSSTEEVIRQSMCTRLTYYKNEKNIGMTGNWNRCIELARGEWVSLLHDDDYLSPLWLQKMLEYLPADADMMASYARVGDEAFSPDSFDLGAGKLLRLSRVNGERMILGNISPAPGLLIRKAVLLDVGGFDESYYPCADYDLYTRLAVQRNVYLYPEVLSYYRTSDSETYKGDTLQKMAAKSAWIKRGLLQCYHSWTAMMYYLETMRAWYQLALLRGIEIDVLGRADKIAKLLGCYRFLGDIFSLPVRVFVRLALHKQQIYLK